MRSIAPMESHGGNGILGYCLSLPFYLVTIFFSFFPWCIYLPGVISRLRHGLDSPQHYLLGGAALVFLVFTLIQTKLPHYTLPAFPLLAILTAKSLNLSRRSEAEPDLSRRSKAEPDLSRRSKPEPDLSRRSKAEADLTNFTRWLVGATVVLYLLIAFIGFPALAPHFPSKAAYESVKQSLTPDTRVAYVTYDEQSLVWYFRYIVKPFLVRISPEQVQPFMNSSSSAVCVVTKTDLVLIPIDATWKQIEVSGFDFARWQARKPQILPTPDSTDLIVLVKSQPGG